MQKEVYNLIYSNNIDMFLQYALSIIIAGLVGISIYKEVRKEYAKNKGKNIKLIIVPPIIALIIIYFLLNAVILTIIVFVLALGLVNFLYNAIKSEESFRNFINKNKFIIPFLIILGVLMFSNYNNLNQNTMQSIYKTIDNVNFADLLVIILYNVRIFFVFLSFFYIYDVIKKFLKYIISRLKVKIKLTIYIIKLRKKLIIE